jgi:hypothetical protein
MEFLSFSTVLCTRLETLRDQLPIFNNFVPGSNFASMMCYVIILAKFIAKKFKKTNTKSGIS